MALYKKGTCQSSTIVSSSIYKCTNCNYTEIIKDCNVEEKICPQCQSKMRIISSQTCAVEDA